MYKYHTGFNTHNIYIDGILVGYYKTKQQALRSLNAYIKYYFN